MKIGICGTRRRSSLGDYRAVHNAFLNVYRPGDTLVSGGCKTGGDHFAEEIARDYGVPITIYPAHWAKYGKAAGFIRNTDIARESDVLIACVSEDRTGGTEDTIAKYQKFGKDRLILV